MRRWLWGFSPVLCFVLALVVTLGFDQRRRLTTGHFIGRVWASNASALPSILAIITVSTVTAGAVMVSVARRSLVDKENLLQLPGLLPNRAPRSTLLRWSCHALPAEVRERYLEEWEAHLNDLHRRRRLPYILGLLWGMPRLVIALRRPLQRPVR